MKAFQLLPVRGRSLHYIPSLDGLRGLGAILVIVTHYGYVQDGWIALEFFFVLSGFLITANLLADMDRSFGEYLVRFYWRRVLRTFPAYFGFLLICVAVYFCVRLPQGFLGALPSLATYWYNFKLLAGSDQSSLVFGHLWSMSVEEQFYLVWPLLVFVLRGANLRRVIIAIVVLIPLLRLATFGYFHLKGLSDLQTTLIFYFTTPFHVDAFSVGAAIACFRLTELELKPHWVFLGGGCALLLGLVNMWIGQNLYNLTPGLSFGYPIFLLQNRQFLWAYSVIDALAAALIVSASQQNRLQRFCENRFLWHLGRISYGFYIVHMPILYLLKPIRPTNRWSLTGVAFFVAFFVITLCIAHLSYFFFERRFLLLKDYFGKRKAGLIAPE
jgi:peptidoglycan/LPS O-acetylase OafA/YrhL